MAVLTRPIFETKIHGGAIEKLGHTSWRLSIPEGPAGIYRCAQLDDYHGRKRDQFLWSSPMGIKLRARISHQEQPGTWGFGFWNDPFSANLGLNGMGRKFPVLPNTAWFFHASPPNFLALRDDHPTEGMLAATFASKNIPAWILGMTLPFTPLVLFRPVARMVRRLGRSYINEAAEGITADLTSWHTYALELDGMEAAFLLDDRVIYTTRTAPRGRLGFVAWVDNQYAYYRPEGKIGFGTLANTMPAWLEIEDPVFA
jgi:hypothetical protein